MNWIRSFTNSANSAGTRDLEDAPLAMRQELIDLFFSLSEHSHEVPPEHVYRATSQSLGIQASGMPYGGFRYASGRDVRGVDWPRIYDLVGRLWRDFERYGYGRQFRDGTNRILAAYGVAWELDEDGRLSRVLPAAAQVQVSSAFAELQNPRFAPALELFNAGRNAYDDRPRRDRDACTNIFDSLESVAKEKYAMPTATYGQVVAHIRQNNLMNPEIVGLLGSLNDLRNRNFGHGMIAPFALIGAEVDLAYLTCIGAILLIVRTP